MSRVKNVSADFKVSVCKSKNHPIGECTNANHKDEEDQQINFLCVFELLKSNFLDFMATMTTVSDNIML